MLFVNEMFSVVDGITDRRLCAALCNLVFSSDRFPVPSLKVGFYLEF